jgi:hypothetical protein
MAHFAEIDPTNTVIRVIVIGNDDVGEPNLSFPQTEPVGQEFIANVLNIPGTWLQCSYHANFRGAFPGHGWSYSPTLDEFVAPVE